MKRAFKLTAIALALVMVLVTAGCTQTPPVEASKDAAQSPASQAAPEAEPKANPEKKLKVAVCFAALLGDKSFNDSCKAGVEKAVAEIGADKIEVYYSESKSNADWEPNLISAASGGYDMVIVMSGQQKDVLNTVAPQFPDQKFGAIDISLPGVPNVMGTIFAQNEGSFIAGAAAAMFTAKTNIPGVNDKSIVGWVGGKDIPILSDFFIGFKEGAQYIDPNITVLQSYAGTFQDPLKGKELTLAQYDQGADIVMNVASGTGVGILEAAKERDLYAIGVDLNQDSLQPGHVLTSMLKNVDAASYSFVKMLLDDSFSGGTTKYMDVKSGGVGLTDFSVMKEALGENFPQDIVDKCDQIAKDIADGKIVVSEFPGVR